MTTDDAERIKAWRMGCDVGMAIGPVCGMLLAGFIMFLDAAF